MLKGMVLSWKKDFKDPLKQVCIKVEDVPKGKLRKIAKQYGTETRKEGVCEFFELDFGTLRLKFARQIKGWEKNDR